MTSITPDTAVETPLPWFLGEPSTHPEAAPLAERVATRLGEQGTCVVESGPLRLARWAAFYAHTLPGIGVWWYGKVVLLATRTGAVWLYRRGPWEAALHAALETPPDASRLDAADAIPPESPVPPAARLAAPAAPPGPSSPAWTGGAVPGQVVEREAAQQAMIDASTAAFRHRLLGYQRQRADGAR